MNVKVVNVSKDNPRYSTYDENKLIIGKSSIGNDEYDHLFLCVRSAKAITIPSFITCISSSAFERCSQLRIVEFEPKSELREIGTNAFLSAIFESFTLPSHVTKICGYAFSLCAYLRKVDIPEDSELQIIDECAFSETSIGSFIIPPHVSHIGEKAFSYCEQLRIIEIDENSIIESIDLNIFYENTNVFVMIPTKKNIVLINN